MLLCGLQASTFASAHAFTRIPESIPRVDYVKWSAKRYCVVIKSDDRERHLDSASMKGRVTSLGANI
jgi:hypothetical protein